MPRPRKHVPTYRIHKQSGQAVVTINHNGKRREILLGKYGMPESRSEYQRIHGGADHIRHFACTGLHRPNGHDDQ